MSTNLETVKEGARQGNNRRGNQLGPEDPLRPRFLGEIARYWWVELLAGSCGW